ncbi:hypothetical protein NDU88_008885 [Pleurodeles waltl]|uniref:Uncharacterized protein n=1 Tax=Pleurodeles waltl TaxID=8319 RepID=A0AAV7PUC5_PLEWA|nr:hypothetical protein NDU88_008885 [Pleurodeles waltl]
MPRLLPRQTETSRRQGRQPMGICADDPRAPVVVNKPLGVGTRDEARPLIPTLAGELYIHSEVLLLLLDFHIKHRAVTFQQLGGGRSFRFSV